MCVCVCACVFARACVRCLHSLRLQKMVALCSALGNKGIGKPSGLCAGITGRNVQTIMEGQMSKFIAGHADWLDGPGFGVDSGNRKGLSALETFVYKV